MTRVERLIQFENLYPSTDTGHATPCWIWPYAVSPNGYAQVCVGRRTLIAHRLRWEHDNDPVPAGMQLDHLCGQRRCVNPGHLEVVTPLQNARRSKSAKLSDEQAAEIFKRKQMGERTAELAEEFRVCDSTIVNIARNGPHGPRRPDLNATHRKARYPSASAAARRARYALEKL